MSENNNLSQFSYRNCILGESNPSLTPNFWISEFPCFTHVFEIQVSGRWKRISKKRERCFLKTNQCTKTSFSLYTGVTELENQMHLWAPIFNSLAKFLGKSWTNRVSYHRKMKSLLHQHLGKSRMKCKSWNFLKCTIKGGLFQFWGYIKEGRVTKPYLF